MHTPIDHVFIGTLRPLPPEGQLTGMFKQAVDGPVAVTAEGLAGDQQGNRRCHGGPEKALHHFPTEHYARLAQRYPAHAGRAQRAGHNQLVFDDSDQQLRVQLKSTQHASELNLGHLVHPAGNYRGSFRGTGAEVRTDAWGALPTRTTRPSKR